MVDLSFIGCCLFCYLSRALMLCDLSSKGNLFKLLICIWKSSVCGVSEMLNGKVS